MSDPSPGREEQGGAERPNFTTAERLWILALGAIAAVFVLYLLHGGAGNSSYDALLAAGALLNVLSIAGLYARRSLRRADHRFCTRRRPPPE